MAASFIRAGLVDEFQLVVHPVVLGGGTPYWPAGVDQRRLRLVEARTFKSGVVNLHYARV